MRSPRCEWPGCGARAARCDLDHDLAWPAGATCACNVGPLCRRHHRVKQLGWTKQRTEHGVTWTGPTGRRDLSRHQHLEVPEPHPAAPVCPDPLAELSPLAREHELWHSDPTDPMFTGLDNDDPGPGPRRAAEEAAAQRSWIRQLAALRREIHHTPH